MKIFLRLYVFFIAILLNGITFSGRSNGRNIRNFIAKSSLLLALLTLFNFPVYSQFTCGDNVTFTYNGSSVTYGTVLSQGKCWLDRNLGATAVATSSTHEAAYGHLFQWGRLDDGHQIRTSGTSSTLSSTDNPGHANFILAPDAPYDWRNPQNDNLWQGVSGTNNPCPSGWRVPTEAEWTTEMNSWGQLNSTGAFNSPLKLPVAGSRSGISGSLFTDGTYWSSTCLSTSSRYLSLGSSAGMFSNYRADGFSVRCIRECVAPAINTHPTNQAICAGTNTTFSVNASGTGLSYQWQLSIDGGTSWADQANGGVYSGMTTATMTITNATTGMNNYRYRCVVSGDCEPAVTSMTTFLTVQEAPAITTQPPNRTICVGGNTTFNVSATGAGLSYQWQISTNGGSSWANQANGGVYSYMTTATMSITGATAGMNTYQYRCVVSGTCGTPINSNAGILTVDPTSVGGTAASAQTICTGTQPADITLSGHTGTIQWQYSNDGATEWINISGAIATPLTSAAMGTLTADRWYRAQVTSGVCAAVFSSTVKVTVNPNNTITLSSATGTDAQTVTQGTAITNITYTTTGATGIGTPTGLPAGVTASWASDTITITGTPTETGIFNYSVPLTGGCGVANATGTITVEAASNPCDGVTPPSGYGIVASLDKCWLDRNLGATAVATSSTHEAAYGDLFQWGRGMDGHESRISGTTSTLSSSDTPGHNEFILVPDAPNDWRDPQNDNLWQGVSGTNNPCPNGWRVPTNTEWNTERLSWGTDNAAGAFASPLKLPLAGLRLYSNGTFFNVNNNGYYWSSAVLTTKAELLQFSGTGAGNANLDRAYGNSVRCIKDDCTPNTVTLSSATGTDAQTVTQGTAITNITYNTTGATGIGTPTGLPAGVTASWAADVITISGTPTESGIFNYSVPLTGGCGSVSATGTITVEAASNPCDGVSTVSDNDGNSYATVAIGTQCWFAENLKTTKYRTGNVIENATDNTAWENNTTGAYAWYNNDEATYKATYGALYNWHAATNGSKLCPPGWKVPAKAEYDALLNFVGTTDTERYLTLIDNGSSGFDALLGGWRHFGGSYLNFTSSGYLWSSTSWGTDEWALDVISSTQNAAMTIYTSKNMGFSIRCLKDTTTFSNLSITGNLEFCSGSSTTLTAEPGATATYEWSNSETSAAINVSPSVTTTYTVTVTNGGDTESISVVVKVLPVNTVTLSSATGTDNQNVTEGTPITNITYTTTGATGIGTPTGLPAGVTASWASDTITITGTPTETGIFNYSVPLTGGCGVANATGTITVEAASNPCDGVTPPSGYGIVASLDKCWLDRNLGATAVATSSTHEAAYGDLFQWGRGMDGHESRISGTTSTLSSSDTPGHNEFILVPDAPYDWLNPQNDNLWQGVSGTNNPCPSGWRVPTEAEWDAERQSWGTDNAAGAFASPLKLTLAGRRQGIDGLLEYVGTGSRYWSSTVSGTHSRRLGFDGIVASFYNTGRGGGSSVRCLKDDCTTPNTVTLSSATGTDDQTVIQGDAITTITYQTTGATGIGTPTGLPAGVTASWNNNVITISGTPTTTGTFNYTVPLAGGCGVASATGTITVEDNPCDGVTTVSDNDGNTYATVAIGTQCWFAKNLATTKYRTGVAVPITSADTSWANLTSGSYVWYNNDAGNKDTYGALYNWFAVESSNHLCPAGWKVPTKAEYETLLNFVGSDSLEQYTALIDNGSSGFNALFGGRRLDDGSFDFLGNQARFWSSTESVSIYAGRLRLRALNQDANISEHNLKQLGQSVRCIKEVCTEPPATPAQGTHSIGYNQVSWKWSYVQGAVGYKYNTVNNYAGATDIGYTNTYVQNGLAPQTNYNLYVWAYNDCGISTEVMLSATTITDPCQGISSVNDNDNNTYSVVAIGTQCWFAENLKTTKYRTGESIVNLTDFNDWFNTNTGAYVWYNNNITYKDAHGALYNWYAVDNPSGLCPTGWIVPSQAEWVALRSFTGGSSLSGGRLKTTTGWWQSGNGTNDYGFNANGSGMRRQDNDFFVLTSMAVWWNSTEVDSLKAGLIHINHDRNDLFVATVGASKERGSSIRCLRDITSVCPVPATPGTITGSATQSAGATGQTYSTTAVSGATEYSWSVPNGWTITAGQSTTEITVTAGTAGQNGDIIVVAINDCGDSDPTTLAVTVAADPCDGVNMVSDNDGNFYAIVAIGTQCWFAKNLATTKYRTGNAIINAVDSADWVDNTTGAYVWYDNNISNKPTYGALYNWHAVNNGSKLCPPGWKVPTDAEWYQMENFVDPTINDPNATGWRGTDGGTKLKATSGWNSGGNGTDDFNFTALPGGYRGNNGTFYLIGNSGYWWSSTENLTTNAYYRYMHYSISNVSRGHGSKDYGFSVRCVRDFDLFGHLTISGNLEICSGSSTTLTAEPGATATYAWSNSATTAAITVNPTVTTTYTVSVTSGSDTESISVVVKILPANTVTLSSATGTDAQTVTQGTAITNITYNTTGATGIGTPTGLPAGVTASWNNKVITISGTPTTTGTFNYSVPLTGGCGVANATGTITVEAASDPCDGVNMVSDNDGNFYAIVAIGTQCWFAENLKTTKYRTGSAIPNVTNATDWSNLTTGAYVWYQNDGANKNIYGGLYNWYAVNNTNKLCPTGWRVPTDDELFTLNNFVDPTATTNINGYVGTDGATKLKTTNSNTPPWNGTDDFGFTALPTGDRDHLGVFSSIGGRTIMWSTTNSNVQPATHAFYRLLISGANAVYRSAREKESGNSVRCLRDTTDTYCPIPVMPTAGTHDIGYNQIVWKWHGVQHAIGYKYNTTDNYNTAIDLGADTTFTQTSLSENSSHTLYVWAYNACGESTTLTLNATTTTHPCDGIATVTDADNNNYNTLVIGNQCWLKENLKTTKYSNGLSIDNAWNEIVWNSLNTGAYVWYSNDVNFKNNYGALYNWYAVNDIAGLCPTNWKVPSDNEWSILEHHVETTKNPVGNTTLSTFINNTGWRGSTTPEVGPGDKLKSSSMNSPSWNGTNAVGFAAVPAGYRNNAGSYAAMGNTAAFWTSAESGIGNAFMRELSSSSVQSLRIARDKKEGYSVRCLYSGSACPLPVLTGSITGPIEVCPNTTGLTYAVTNVSDVDTYVWTVPTGWTITDGHGTNSITVTADIGAQNGNISVIGENNCGSSTPIVKGLTVVVAPATPVEATHTTGPHQIQWYWQGASAATGYLYSSTDNVQTAISTTDSTYLQTGLNCDGIAYNLYVWAYNQCDTSAYQLLSATTAACIIFTSHPVNEQVCENENANFSVVVDGTGLNYQWQVSTNGGTTWNNLSNGGVYSNVMTATLTITGVLFSMDDYRYRCDVSGVAGIPAYSNDALLKVDKAPDIILPPVNISVCENTTATFDVLADGANLLYVWKESTDGGNTWNELTNTSPYSGVNSTQLTIDTANALMDGNRYRVHVIGTCAPTEAVSIPALLTIATESIITLTSVAGTDDQVTCTGVPIVSITYSVQSATDATFTGLPQGVTGSYIGHTVTISGTPQTTGVFNYTFNLVNGCGPNTVGAGTITVGSAPQVPVAQPATTITETSCFANWNAVQGATAYQLDVAINSSFTNMLPGYDNLDVSNVTTHQVTGLQCNMQYFYRVRAVKGSCVSTHSSNITVQTPGCTCPNIGDFIDGGYYAYRLQPGDPGYIAGHCVGIILAPNDLSDTDWGCFGQSVATSTALSSGYNNTLLIVNDCPSAGIAADVSNNAVINSYSDWFLPSLNELQKVYENKDDLGVIAAADYWSSSEESAGNAYVINFTDGVVSNVAKNLSQKVRPVRYLLPPPSAFTSDTVCFGDTIAYFVPPAPGVTHYTWMFTNTATGITDTLSAYTTNQVQVIASEDGVLSVIAHNNCGTSTLTRELEIIVYHYGGLEWIGVVDTDWFKPENWASPMAAVKSNNLGCPLRIPGSNTHVTVNPDISIFQPIIHPDSAKGEIAQSYSIYIGAEDSIFFNVPNNDTIMTLTVHGHFKLDGRVLSDNDSSFIILRSDTGQIEFAPMLLKSSGDMCRSCIFILEDGANYTVVENDAEARKIIIEGDAGFTVDDGLTLEVFDLDIETSDGAFSLENNAQLHIAGRIETLGDFDVTLGTVYYNSGSDKWLVDSGYVSQTVITTVYKHLKANAGNADDSKILTIGNGGTIECETFELINMDDYPSQATTEAHIEMSSTFNLANTLDGQLLTLDLRHSISNPDNNSSFNMGDSIIINVFYTHATDKAIDITAASVDFKGTVNYSGLAGMQVMMDNAYNNLGIITHSLDCYVQMETDISVNNVLTLFSGKLILNENTLTIDNKDTAAIVRNGIELGFIYSETGTKENLENIVRWNVEDATGTYIVPFGKSANEIIPFGLNLVANNMGVDGFLKLSTYKTATDNTPYPIVSGQGQIGNYLVPSYVYDYVMNRYWYIDYKDDGGSFIEGRLTMSFLDVEIANVINGPSMMAVRYNPTGGTNGSWVDVIYVQGTSTGMPIVGGAVLDAVENSFTTGYITKSQFKNVWLLTNQGTPLPITLLHFNAECRNDKVYIGWATATETNNDYFTVERSQDAVNWEEIAKVDGAGTSSTQNNYYFTDHEPYPGISYYRLIQTDFDGNKEEFSPVDVNCRLDQQTDLIVYPNPFTGIVTIEFVNMPATEASFRIYDALGRVVMNRKITGIEAGYGTITLDLGHLANGVYHLELISDQFIHHEKITKQL